MAADRIWRLYPHAVDADDDAHVDVWVNTAIASDLVVAERERTVVTGYLRGSPISYSVTQSIQTRVVRIRYREDLSVRGVIVDEAGVNWFVDGWQEVGRRAFLDVSCTAYDLVSPIETGTGTPPGEMPTAVAGWHLQDGNGNPLLEFDGETIRTIYGRRGLPDGIRLRLEDDWQIAQGEAFAVDDVFEGELSDGTDVRIRFRALTGQLTVEQLNVLSGQWPVASAVMYVSTDPGQVNRNVDASVNGLRIGRSS